MSDASQPQTQSTDKAKFIRTYAKDVATLSAGEGRTPVAQAAPTPRPMPAPPERIVLPTPPIDTGKQEALERMRARVEAQRKEAPPAQPVAPVFVAPPAERIAPLPPVVQQPRPEPELSPIHTYKSDFADHIDAKSASSFSVLAAQQDAKPVAPITPVKRKNIVLIVIASLLVALGGGGLATAIWYVVHTNTIPGSTPSVSSLVFSDEQVRLTGSGPELMSELAALANEPLTAGNILVVYLTQTTNTEKGGTIELPLQGGALISAMQLPAPEILLRNISAESTVGIINAGGETRPFFVFGVSSYQRTFAGMLAWERSMAQDLVVLYPARSAGQLTPTGTSTTIGTSTPAYTAPVRAQDSFKDAIVANHDVRILQDTSGKTLILYGYVGKNILIIARDEAAYTALISRLTINRDGK